LSAGICQPKIPDSRLFRLAVVAMLSHAERFSVESYNQSRRQCFMHGDAREGMPSILVRVKIITRFLGTEPRARIYEVLWVIYESESTDAKWPFAQMSADARLLAVPLTVSQCQPVTWFCLRFWRRN
jgi:hypothetical protein